MKLYALVIHFYLPEIFSHTKFGMENKIGDCVLYFFFSFFFIFSFFFSFFFVLDKVFETGCRN